jgi:enoyl-CoA hydratase/carnithine racemase
VTREIVFGDKVVIGAIQGWAVGGGFEWALNCDFPIWAESAKGFFPEVGWGLFVTGGVTTILPNIVGLPKAKEMLMFGERYTARDLADLGVAWRVVPDADLMAEAEAVASRLAALPARAVRDMKRTLVRAAHGDIATALDLETEATVRSRMDPDTPGRIAAFAARK